ncbi:MAG: carbohydrate binding domain-containing protein [Flavobacteriales bacterium]|nr:carbohydrate binding domain-containing protein [Flavobacteriales bacterium]
MRTALLSILLLAGSAASAQFTSGFENWPDTVPGDWMGSKTTLNADSVMQVSTDVHGGMYAARLQNSGTGHKRFTTQPTSVTDGVIYTVSFWVRGQGNIRTGLYDGRAASSGYSAYNAYYNSTGNTWTEVTQQLVAANTSAAAEVILSIQSTVGPEFLVVDDVNITGGGAPVAVSIYDIQYTTDVSGNSPYAGQIVLTGGIVTGVDTIGTNSYFIQSGTGPWTGISVFDAVSVVAIGDSLTLQASASEYNGLTELGGVSNLVIVGQFPVPAPEVLTPNAAQEEQWEGVLATVENIGCVAPLDVNNQWTGVSTTAGSLIVDDLMYLYTPTVGNFYSVTGCLTYTFAERKIEPRFLADIAVGSSVNDLSVQRLGFYPNPASDVIRMDLGNNGQRVEYTMIDATGRTVMAGSLTSNVLNVQELVNGAYTLTIRSSDTIRQARVLVQH